MAQRLRIAGLALGIMLLTSAALASQASAGSFTASQYPATLVQETPVTGDHTFEFGSGTLTCKTAHFDSVGELTGASKSFEVTPTYSSCQVPAEFGNKPGTVVSNGCTFEFTAIGGSAGSIHLECPEGSALKILIYNSTSDHGSNKPVCEYLAEPQSFEGIGYTNVSPTYMKASISSTIAVTRASGTEVNCGGVSQNVTYSGSTIFEAKSGAMVDFNLSGGQFTASKYNATVTGRQSVAPNYQVTWAGGRSMSCYLQLAGPEALTEASESMTVDQEYAACAPTFPFVLAGTIIANSCEYDLSITEGSGGLWTGETELECPGKAMEVLLFSSATTHAENKVTCKYVVEPQKVTGVTYSVKTAWDLRLEFNSTLSMKRVAGSALVCGAEMQTPAVAGTVPVTFVSESGEPVELLID